jgi:thioredoxin 1
MQTTFIVIALVVGVILFSLYRARVKIKNTPLTADHENILTLTDINFKQQTKNKVVLIDFWATWCAPCRMMAPVLNDVASEISGNSHIGKVNIEQYKSLAQKFNVRSIPTLILLKNGIEVNRFVGLKSKDFILQQIQKA